MKKRFLLLSIFIIIICFVSGCSKDPAKLKLYSEDYVMKEVKSDNIDAEYLRKVESDLDDPRNKRVTYFFKDKNYGFEFNYETYLETYGIDGTTGLYRSVLVSDYLFRLYDYIEETYKDEFDAIVEKYNANYEIEPEYHKATLKVSVESNEIKDINKAVCEIYNVYAKHDKNKYFEQWKFTGERLSETNRPFTYEIKDLDCRNY